MARLLLAGYFGCGNLGDDAILLGFLDGIHGRGHQINVLAGSPESVGRNYSLTATNRMDNGRVQEAIKQSDALVFPGGSVFQDSTSIQSLYYYVNLVKAAKKHGKRVIMLGQGVGPINRWLGKTMAASAFNAADVICVRDPQSATTLKDLGVKKPIKITADSAFLLPKPELADHNQASYAVGHMRTIGFSIRPVGRDKGKSVVDLFSQVIQWTYDKGYVPTMIAMDAKMDQPLVEAVSKACNGKVPELKGMTNPKQVQERIMRMDAVVSMRLHTGILASTVGVPSFMVSYDPKVSAFANMMGFPAPLKIEGLTAPRLCNALEAFMADIGKTAQMVDRRREELFKSAQGNIDALTACIG